MTDGGEGNADDDIDDDDAAEDFDDVDNDSESGAVPNVELIAVGVEIVVDVFK